MRLQIHPIPPVYSMDSKILILGSFPSVKSRQTGFYYGNPQNRFWRVLEAIIEEALPEDAGGRRDYLIKHRIALWDALYSCEILGSSDASIKNPVPNKIDEILNYAPITRILANGQLASRMIKTHQGSAVREKLYTLPSTSPANASWSFEDLIKVWSQAILQQ